MVTLGVVPHRNLGDDLDDDLFSIAQTGPSALTFAMGRYAAGQITNLTVNDEVLLATPAAVPDRPVTGRLSRIAPQAQKDEGATLFDVEIELDPGQEVVLRAGYSANAEIVIREKHEVVMIPERLVVFSDDASESFVERPGEGEARACQTAVKLRLLDSSTSRSEGLGLEIRSSAAAARGWLDLLGMVTFLRFFAPESAVPSGR
jgi:hypothetical protein